MIGQLESFFSHHTFDVVLRGYARRQVDDYVDVVNATVEGLRSQISELDERVKDLAAQLAEHETPSYTGLGVRVQEILRLAETEATDLVDRAPEQARADHDDVLAAARQQADKIVRTAHADAETVREEARHELVDIEHHRAELDTRVAALRAALDQINPLPERQAA